MVMRDPPVDKYCLRMGMKLVEKRVQDPEVIQLAKRYEALDDIVSDYRAREQIDDAMHVLPFAPRLPCFPPMRVRFDAHDPQCVERSLDYMTFAEILDPETPRTLMTIRVGEQLHVLVIELTEDGTVPVILDPLNGRKATVSENLSHAAVARMFGYAKAEPSPAGDAVAWAELVAKREGVQPRNSSELLAVVERYADAYPGGRQGLADLAGRLGETLTDAARGTVKAGKKVARAGKVVAEAGLEEYKKRPKLGQILRSAIVGYGGPFAVVAIDVVENRLNKRGYSLGELAESHDADVFAIK